jgi:acetyl-CoA carboxylase biotin carboxyl carrier protein
LEIDLKTIRELLAIVGETDITELTIESGDKSITVKKAASPAQVIQHTAVEAVPAPAHIAVAPPHKPVAAAAVEPKAEPAKQAAPEPENTSNGHIQITSPMVGTFYRSPSPSAPPFVKIGDHVNVGQTVCIIEAMKLMNDMPSEVQGKITKILVDNGTTVEYGQALFLVDPKG